MLKVSQNCYAELNNKAIFSSWKHDHELWFHKDCPAIGWLLSQMTDYILQSIVFY